MRYTWTTKFVTKMALTNRKLDKDTLYEVCMLEASRDKEGALDLYSLVREKILKNHRTF